MSSLKLLNNNYSVLENENAAVAVRKVWTCCPPVVEHRTSLRKEKALLGSKKAVEGSNQKMTTNTNKHKLRIQSGAQNSHL